MTRLVPRLTRKEELVHQVAEGLMDWLEGKSVGKASAGVAEGMQSVPIHEIPALLRQLRSRLFGYQFGRHSSKLEKVAARLAATPIETKGWMRVALLAHPNGYVREELVKGLEPETRSGTIGLLFAADDHVPEVCKAAVDRLPRVAPRFAIACLPVVTRETEGSHREAWRALMLKQLTCESARDALSSQALTERGKAAVEAWKLLQMPGRDAIDAVSWRVRVLGARDAVAAQDLEAAEAYFSDSRVAVRYAAAWQAAHLDSPAREGILELGLSDDSARVLRIVLSYLKTTPAALTRARALLDDGGSVRNRGAGVRLCSVLPEDEARGALRAALSDPAPSVRVWGFRVLSEQGWLENEHVEALLGETDPIVLAAATRAIVRQPKYAAALRPLLDTDVFRQSRGPKYLVASLPVWERCPLVLRALAEEWPTAESLLGSTETAVQRCSTLGWLGPSARHAERIGFAIEKYENQLPGEADPFLDQLKRTIGR